jgi:hypothetical protein
MSQKPATACYVAGQAFIESTQETCCNIPVHLRLIESHYLDLQRAVGNSLSYCDFFELPGCARASHLYLSQMGLPRNKICF